jgi:abortive infection alpha-like protein
MADDLVGLGKIPEAIEKFTKECRELLLRLLGPAADAAGERLGDWINAARSKNFERIVQEVVERLRQAGIEPKPVELKILIPIIQHSSVEENTDLASIWAGLLASAAAGEEIHPSYPKILAELTPGEARLLNTAGDEWDKRKEEPDGYVLLKETRLTEEELPRAMFSLDTRHSLIHFYGQKWGPDLRNGGR